MERSLIDVFLCFVFIVFMIWHYLFLLLYIIRAIFYSHTLCWNFQYSRSLKRFRALILH